MESSINNHGSTIQHQGPAYNCTFQSTTIIKETREESLHRQSTSERNQIVPLRRDKEFVGREVAQIVDILDNTNFTISALLRQCQDTALKELETELRVLRFHWTGIKNWTSSNLDDSHYQLMIDMDSCMACFRLLMSKIDEEISQLQVTAGNQLDAASNNKLLPRTVGTDKVQLNIQQQKIALHRLLSVCDATMPLEQKGILEEPQTREVFKKMEYSASLLVHRDVDSLLSRTASSITSSLRSFAFDSELFASGIYARWIRGSVKKSLRQQQSGNSRRIRDGKFTRTLPAAKSIASLVIPLALRQGTSMSKVSKKSKCFKRITLVLDWDAAKLWRHGGSSSKMIYFHDINEIQTAPEVRQYGLDYGVDEVFEPQFFTIIYRKPGKSEDKMLHLVADSSAMFQNWIGVLDAISKHYREFAASLVAFSERAVGLCWQRASSTRVRDENGLPIKTIDFKGLQGACQELDIHMNSKDLGVNYVEALDMKNNGEASFGGPDRFQQLDYEGFLEFIRLVKTRDDIHKIYCRQASECEKGLTFQEFQKFLKHVQYEDIEEDPLHWERVFTQITRIDKLKGMTNQSDDTQGPHRMSESSFAYFLASKFNAPIVEPPAEFTLDQPLNEYYISSSHKTYLVGGQVAGSSSVNGYVSALVSGCRCVEVDCRDGSSGEPEVNNGRVLTGSISFRDVITTISKYAFISSKFPLWVSLDVRCSANQQAKMVDIMKEAFGSRLVTETLDGFYDKLPSPSELMERILVSFKKPQNEEERSKSDLPGRQRGNSINSPRISADSAVLMPYQPLHQSRPLTRVNTITEDRVQEMMSDSTSEDESGEEQNSQKSTVNTVKELSGLAVYCTSVKFSGFDSPAAKTFNHMLSFMEPSFARHSRTNEDKIALDIHNMRHLMRVYPDSVRFTSSNFEPLVYWRRGVQMAALNWQTFDLGMQLNHAMFNGGTDRSGYVLKPVGLQAIQVQPYNLDIAEGKKKRVVVSFSIDMISAQQLMRPVNLPANKSMDPYVEVEIFHVNDKRDKKEADLNLLVFEPDSALKDRTDVRQGNGFNPIFDKQFKFRVTTELPDMIFVRWSVKLSNEGDDYRVATYTAKLTNMKQGYRNLPLLNHAGDQYLFSTLFCRIKVDSIEPVLIDMPRRVQDGNKLNRLGSKVFSRINTSSRSTFERSSYEE